MTGWSAAHAGRNLNGVAKDDDEKPICDVCLGNQGEWLYPNGDSTQTAKKWVPCKPCGGTGRR